MCDVNRQRKHTVKFAYNNKMKPTPCSTLYTVKKMVQFMLLEIMINYGLV